MARRVLAALNSGSLGVSIGFAVTAAVLLNPILLGGRLSRLLMMGAH